MTADSLTHYVEHVVTGSPACGATLGFSGIATSTRSQVTCPDCRAALGTEDGCSSCGHLRDHPAISHRPTRHAVWCVWMTCGHHISRGDTACTEEHPQEGTPVPEPTEDKPPAKKAARKAAAPPPASLPGKYSPQQEVRFVSLGDAAQLLTELGDHSAADLLTVARWIVNGDQVDDPDDGGPGLTFVGAPTNPTTTTNTEGATQ